MPRGLVAVPRNFRTKCLRMLLFYFPGHPRGKAQKDVADALNDLRDLIAFHQKVSIAMGTSLQHLSCCFSCSFCSFTRASAKERSKTRSLSEQNKACQMCMLCKSMPFCPVCSQCPQCCLRTECRGKIAKFLAKHGFESSGSLYPQGGLHSSLQTKAPFDKVPLDSKRLLKSNQEHVSEWNCFNFYWSIIRPFFRPMIDP